MEDFPHNDNSVCESKNTRLHRADSWGKALVGSDERPGLGSPDSLSAYFTYKPRWESVESDRNCISNIRMQGMPPKIAARKLALLLGESLRLGIGGTALKDNIDDAKLLES